MSVSISPKRPEEARYEISENETYPDSEQTSFLCLSLENVNVTARTQPSWSLRVWSLSRLPAFASGFCCLGFVWP